MANQSAFSVIFSSRAQKEINESWNWYEERQPGLGDRFLKEVMDRIYIMIQRISKHRGFTGRILQWKVYTVKTPKGK